jgi:dienelactone hydrolase
MNALAPVVLAGLLAGAAPPETWTSLADRLPIGKHDPDREHERVRSALRGAGTGQMWGWLNLEDRQDWEKFRDERLARLRTSLGRYPAPPRDLKVCIRRTLEGDGYRIDNLTYESRPGLLVTANLYRPARPGKAMPGFVIIHSHHAPKTQGELQDMGILWARAGCLVLVMDQLGHGERRQHPFRTAADFPKSFRGSRQDYFFRYNLAIELQTIGDGLMGWMVWDVQRGVDLLLSRPGIDPKKIIVLGAVAGGGDPAAVVGALDRRIAAVVPFNFGGPQPETRYPLPADAEKRFLYTGSGSWESTRNLYRSAKDGFLPWVVVGAIASRRHIYAHEFAWDRERDPVWKWLGKIHGWYASTEHLASVHGSGSVRGKAPESTHCTNIGRVHRKGIHTALKEWFGIEAKEPDKPVRHPAEDLLCLGKDDRPGKVHELAGRLGQERLEQARLERAKLPVEARRRRLRQEWERVLGPIDRTIPDHPVRGIDLGRVPGGEAVEYPTAGTVVLSPLPAPRKPCPVVVAFGQGGPRAFLKERSAELAKLLAAGTAVALVDLGGMSNQPPGPARGRQTGATSVASSEQMLGSTMLGRYLGALLRTLARLRRVKGLDPDRITLWGESFAPANAVDSRLEVPLELPQPHLAEPMGLTVALLAALFDDKVHAVRARGGLVGYSSLFSSAFCHVPYDVVVPGVLTVGDLADVVAELAPRPVRLEGLVDGLNRKVPIREAEKAYALAREAYGKAKAAEKLVIGE